MEELTTLDNETEVSEISGGADSDGNEPELTVSKAAKRRAKKKEKKSAKREVPTHVL